MPDLSIEVDDLEVALARFKKANVPIEYGPVSETWGVPKVLCTRSIRKAY